MSFQVEKRTVYLQVYRPVYFQLVDVLLHKAQFPADQEYASWSSDEKEQFRIYRCALFVCPRGGSERRTNDPLRHEVLCFSHMLL